MPVSIRMISFCLVFLAVETASAQQPELVVQLGALSRNTLDFTSDGRYVFILAPSGLIIQWDVATGQQIRTIPGHVVSSSGRFYLVLQDSTMRLCETTTGRQLRVFEGHAQGITRAVFSPDDHYILSIGADNTMRLWEVDTGRQLRVFTGHTGTISAVAFSSDGHLMAAGDSFEGEVEGDKTYKTRSIRLWEVESGKQVGLLEESYHHDEKELEESYHHDEKEAQTLKDPITALAFSPDSRYLLSASRRIWKKGRTTWTAENGTAIIQEISTGKKLQTFEVLWKDILFAGFSPDGRYVLTDGNPLSSDYAIFLWEIATGERVREFPDFHQGIFSPDGRHILTANKDGEAVLLEMSTGKQIRMYKGHAVPFFQAGFSPDSRHILTENWGGTSYSLWDISTGRKIRTIPLGTADRDYRPDVAPISFTPDGRYALVGSYDFPPQMHLLEMATGKNLMSLQPDQDHSFSYEKRLAFSPDFQYLAAVDRIGQYNFTQDAIDLWKVSTGERVRAFVGHPQHIGAIAFSPDGRYLLSGGAGDGKSHTEGDDYSVRLWEVATGKQLQILTGHTGEVDLLTFSPDGRLMLSGSYDRTVRLWEVATGKQVRIFEPEIPFIPAGDYGIKQGEGVESVAFSPGGRFVVVGYDVLREDKSSHTYEYRFWKVEGDEKVYTFPGFAGVFSPDARYFLTVHEGQTLLWDMESGQRIHVISGYNGTFSPDGRRLLTSRQTGRVGKPGDRVKYYRDNELHLWEVESGRQIHAFSGYQGTFSPDGRYLSTLTVEGTLQLWSLESGEKLATFIDVGADDFVTVLPDNHYVASKKGLQGIAFRLGDSAFPAEQFDLKLNRPDLVMERLGQTPPQTLAAYRRLYQRRLRKMGLTEEQLGWEFHLPEVEILSREIPISTTTRSLALDIRATDAKYLLDRLNVYLNNVPVFGVDGIPLRAQKIRSVEKTIAVTLATGANKIQVSALNERGVESLKQTVTVHYEGPAEQPDAYLVAIGVSQYQDAHYNLQYAAKDAQDLVRLYEEQLRTSGQFGQVRTLVLTDADATREKILAAREFLLSSGVDDLAVLFIAGHGLTDDDWNYYYGTHDVDFTRPQLRGLPFDDLDGLLDGIPALRKLFLMDTCFSGEIDKAETEWVVADAGEAQEGQVKVRAFVDKRGLKAGQRLSAETVQVQEDLFADLRRGTGAVIITSSSGDEYSLESDEWRNGVFTYCVLKGLQERASDQNEDQNISVSELRDYVVANVRRLTLGGQNPTMRRENLEDDFTVMWDVGEGQALRVFQGHAREVTAAVFSPDGQYAVSAGGWDKTLRLWDVATAKELRSFTGHTSQVNAVAFAPDGKQVLSGSDDRTLRLWEVGSGEQVRSFTGHGGGVKSVAFSASGDSLLSGSEDKTVRLWDMASGQELKTLAGHTGPVFSVAFAPHGEYAVSGGMDKSVRLWVLPLGRELHIMQGHTAWVRSVAFSPDGQYVVSGSDDATLRLWSVAGGEERRIFAGHTKSVTAVAFSSDGWRVLSGSQDGTLVLWDVESGQQVRVFKGHSKGITAVSFLPVGRFVLSGSMDTTLRLWNF